MTLDGTLDQLLGMPNVPAPPVNHFQTGDVNVPVGSTWVNAPFSDALDVGDYRRPSLRGWYWQNVLHHDFHVRTRLTTFWINHFGMADAGPQRKEYKAIRLFDEFGLGSIKTMIEKITIEPAMLRFLDGQDNNRWSPNENFARELMEVFTIQKGAQTGNGAGADYTFYNEQDVVAIGRVLTGWRVANEWSREDGNLYGYFDPNRHDPDAKQLSDRFDNAVIYRPEGEWEEEYKDVINVIFGRHETARALCRRIYRFFVNDQITPRIISQVIDPLADVMRDADYDMATTLRALFASEHFFDMSVRGPFIKNPMEFMVSVVRPFGGYRHLGLDLETGGAETLRTRYDCALSHHWRCSNLGFDFLEVPAVAGWAAYHQSPQYHRAWIGSATLKQRKTWVDTCTGSGIWTRVDGDNDNYDPRPLDWFGFVNGLDNPAEPSELVAESVQIFLPRELHADQLTALKNELLRGLDDQEWRQQYAAYLASPLNPSVANPIRDRIKGFYRALFSLAEFHLI